MAQAVRGVSLVLALTLLFAMSAVTQATAPDRAARPIWQVEMDRIAAMNRLAAAHIAPLPPPALEDPPSAVAACAAYRGRRIEAASTPALMAALAEARPGDLILLADGVYTGQFSAITSGAPAAPIVLCGSRAAVLEQGSIKQGYGFHLQANFWVLSGFTVRNARKGIVLDGANRNILRSLAIHTISEEGVHFRSLSSDNLLEHSWIYNVGQENAVYGEGIYIGSASSNWAVYSNGQPDRSERNRIIGNLIGPNTPAEGVDIKEGASGGIVAGNIFLSEGMTTADSWIDVKGNNHLIDGNRGMYDPAGAFQQAVKIHDLVPGWGRNNIVTNNQNVHPLPEPTVAPFRALYDPNAAVSIVLPRRRLPYTLTELRIIFPESLETVAPGVILLKEHIVVTRGAHLHINNSDVRELQLWSGPQRFVSIAAFRGEVAINGSSRQPVRIRSWNSAASGSDLVLEDGRAFVLVQGGRMDLNRVHFLALGFGTGATSGVAWRGLANEKSRGVVTDSRFERNYFGAFTFEAEAMRWLGNSFAHNIVYGFDPHDFSNNFLVAENLAYGNGKHGIIFSRGCEGNIIRRNIVYGNRGHGIFLDDGKVLDDGNPRHFFAVPSDNNLVEQNLVWGNDVGIVLEGGAENIVRMNTLNNNRYGIRLKDSVTRSKVAGNIIRGNTTFALYIYNGSSANRITGTTIEGGKGGVVLKQSPASIIEGNIIEDIAGHGIVVIGEATGMSVRENKVAGRGSNAIDLSQATNIGQWQIAFNDTSGWTATGPPSRGKLVVDFFRHHPALPIWLVILLTPALNTLLRRRNHRVAS